MVEFGMDAEDQSQDTSALPVTSVITKRRCLIVSLFGLGTLVCLWLAVKPRHENMRPKLESVKVGMTRDQVLEIVGYPPGNYETTQRVHFLSTKGPVPEIWDFDDGSLHVCFDWNGKAQYVNFYEPYRPGLIEQIRNFLDP